MTRILITGANGFIGTHLAASYGNSPDMRLMVRHPHHDPREIVADLKDKKSLLDACQNMDVVYHCAGYAHAFKGSSIEIEAHLHHEINFQGACDMAEAAVIAGVKRFVFISSVKAVADNPSSCIDESFDAMPDSAYGRAKRHAEDVLLGMAAKTNMEVVCVRPVMTYGEGGHGNMARMARLVSKGLFPPLPEVSNKRSVLHINDLVAALRLVASTPEARGQTYIVADPHPYSGREIYDTLRAAMGMPPIKRAIPASLLRSAAKLGDIIHAPLNTQALERLLGSAYYSPAKIERELGWRAQTSLAQGLQFLRKV